MKLPDFYIVGAAKAGTTTIYALLSQHPDVFMPERKEPEFFARDDRYAAGIASYSELFEPAQNKKLIGEASTIYSLSPLFPKAAERIARHTPKARIIYILRDPVERAYSYYLQLTKNYHNASGDRQIHRSFEDFVVEEQHHNAAPRSKAFAAFDAHLPDTPELCLAGSEYVTQIEAYLDHFPREQILVLKFEDFKSDQARFMEIITDFLDVPPLPDAAFLGGSAKRNVSSDHFAANSKLATIKRLSSITGPLWGIRKLLPNRWRNQLRRLAVNTATKNAAEYSPPEMKPETRKLLAARFSRQNEKLDALTGIRYEL